MILASLLSLAVATAPAAITTTINHASGPVTAVYSGRISIDRQQVGTIAPPGRASTLRCRWVAHLIVDRRASATDGATAGRTFTRSAIAQGSRPGWCGSGAARIDAAVATEAERHLALAAAEDRRLLLDEIERIAAGGG